VRGVELAIDEFGAMAGGRRIELCVEGTVGAPDIAEQKARTLIEEVGVDFIIGPLSGNEGLAVRNYAKTRPERVFLNGSSGAQELTMDDPAPNFFNFSINGAQVVAGLGTYAYKTLGYRSVVTLGEDYSYPHAQIGGFMVEFYRLGGRVIKKLWVPLGRSDFTDVIAAIPSEADAVFVALGGTDAINFLQQYHETGGQKPLFGGGITTDQSVLSSGGLADALVGMVAGGPTADDNPDPNWHHFATAYQTQFPDGFNYPSYFALQYYLNAKAALIALESIGGDLSQDQAHFKAALGSLELAGPSGHVRLDSYRGAIGSSFVTVVKKDAHGVLYRSLLQEVPDVSQTLGLPEAEYRALGTFSKDNPAI